MIRRLRPVCPRIRLRIGVSGHRGEPKLQADVIALVRASVDHLLGEISATTQKVAENFPAGGTGQITNEDIELVIVSSLAEGSDRIVAESGIDAGFTLEVVLPFDRREYIKDFGAVGSLETFDKLVFCASSVFELDGDGKDRPRAYEAAGFVMLANVDILVAIWNGKEAEGIGGTAEIVDRAVSAGIPVIWIDPSRPDEPRVSWSRSDELPIANVRAVETFRTDGIGELLRVITDLLLIPGGSEAEASLKTFFREKERRWNFCPWFPLLLLIFAGRPLRLRDFKSPPYLAESRQDWQTYFNALPDEKRQRPVIEASLLPAYAFADHLAVFYAQVYRSAYIFNFIFAAFAVTLALSGVFIHDSHDKLPFVLAELGIIIVILLTWQWGRLRQWHRRWLEYRRLAECLRQMRFLVLLGANGGLGRKAIGLPADEYDWVAWYARSIQRMLPLPNWTVDSSYLTAVRNAICVAEINGQRLYHQSNAKRMSKIDHRLHVVGMRLFIATAVICICFAVFGFIYADDSPTVRMFVTFLTALLPTVGAALNAIHVQGDFRTVARQSARTVKRLEAIDDAINSEPLEFARLADRLEKTSDAMMADVSEWQTVFRTRPLSLPA